MCPWDRSLASMLPVILWLLLTASTPGSSLATGKQAADTDTGAMALVEEVQALRNSDPGATRRKRPENRDDWKALEERSVRIVLEAQNDLRSKSYERARLSLRDLAVEISETLGEPSLGGVLGMVTTLRAIAEEGLGNRNEALWYWSVAQVLDPRVVQVDLSRFGEIAVTKLFSEPHPELDLLSRSPGFGPLTKPTVVERIPPRFPENSTIGATEGALIVSAIIGLDGRLRQPKVAQAFASPAMNYIALEALKRFRFSPATRGGAPHETPYLVTVNYRP